MPAAANAQAKPEAKSVMFSRFKSSQMMTLA